MVEATSNYPKPDAHVDKVEVKDGKAHIHFTTTGTWKGRDIHVHVYTTSIAQFFANLFGKSEKIVLEDADGKSHVLHVNKKSLENEYTNLPKLESKVVSILQKNSNSSFLKNKSKGKTPKIGKRHFISDINRANNLGMMEKAFKEEKKAAKARIKEMILNLDDVALLKGISFMREFAEKSIVPQEGEYAKIYADGLRNHLLKLPERMHEPFIAKIFFPAIEKYIPGTAKEPLASRIEGMSDKNLLELYQIMEILNQIDSDAVLDRIPDEKIKQMVDNVKQMLDKRYREFGR